MLFLLRIGIILFIICWIWSWIQGWFQYVVELYWWMYPV